MVHEAFADLIPFWTLECELAVVVLVVRGVDRFVAVVALHMLLPHRHCVYL